MTSSRCKVPHWGACNALWRSPDMARRAFDGLDCLRCKNSVKHPLNGMAFLKQA